MAPAQLERIALMFQGIHTLNMNPFELILSYWHDLNVIWFGPYSILHKYWIGSRYQNHLKKCWSEAGNDPFSDLLTWFNIPGSSQPIHCCHWSNLHVRQFSDCWVSQLIQINSKVARMIYVYNDSMTCWINNRVLKRFSSSWINPILAISRRQRWRSGDSLLTTPARCRTL